MTTDYTLEQINLIRKVVAKNATDEDLQFFLEWCKRSGFDPLKKEAVFQYRKSQCKSCRGRGCNECRNGHIYNPVFIASVDGILNRAQQFPTYAGSQSAVVYEKDEFEFDAVNGVPIKHIIRNGDRGKIVAAWCTVYDKTRKPYCYIYLANEYFKITAIESGYETMQQKAPDLMLLKSVQAIAHRRMYPGPFGGVYVPEEFGGYMDSEGNVYMPPESEIVAEMPSETQVKQPVAESKKAVEQPKKAAMLSEAEIKKQTLIAVLNYGETLGLDEQTTRQAIRQAGYTSVEPQKLEEYKSVLENFVKTQKGAENESL